LTEKNFEHLFNNLTRIDPQSSIFNGEVEITKTFSLMNGNLLEWLDELLPNTRLLIEPKIEGCGIALNFEGGNFKKAIDREGNDKTNEIALIRNFPKEIPISKPIHITGQIYGSAVLPSQSKRLAKEFLQGKFSLRDKLSFCCFQLLNSDLNHSQSIKELQRLGFEVPENEFTNYTSDVFLYEQLWSGCKIFCKYPTKGIVLKVNSRKLQKQLGETAFAPRWAYAIDHR